MKKFSILPYLLIFTATFLILEWFQGPVQEDPILSAGTIGLQTLEEDYVIGKDIQVEIQNNGTEPIVIPDRCPEPLLHVYRFTSEGYTEVKNSVERDCSKSSELRLEAGEKTKLSLLDYSYSLFGTAGKYKITVEIPSPTEEDPNAILSYASPEFDVETPGLLRNLFRTLIYQPMLNALVAILIYMPGHHLGLGIIALTILIRTLLLIPSQKAIRAQRRLQEVQPKIEELKKQYGNDQTRLAQETMLLWKTQKVSPFSSCLPILIQMPILIALFYAINGGLSPDRNELLYDFLPEFSLSTVNPLFLGFNLFERSLILFPLVIGGLQFLQIQLMNARKKKNGQSKLPQEVEMANKMMKYMMPAMIAVFTAQLPAAVGLYWGVSTFYGILQQLVVNNESSKPSSSQEEVEVRVIHKKK